MQERVSDDPSCFYINAFATPSEIFTADYIHFKNSSKIAEWTMTAWVDRLWL